MKHERLAAELGADDLQRFLAHGPSQTLAAVATTVVRDVSDLAPDLD